MIEIGRQHECISNKTVPVISHGHEQNASYLLATKYPLGVKILTETVVDTTKISRTDVVPNNSKQRCGI